jgi:hypothetical protein
MIPDLSKCGLSLDILNLDAANKAIEDAMKELSGAAGGIAGSIASLQSQLEGEMNKALAELENLIPEIPDLPPNLQLEMAKLIGLLNDPLKALDLAAQLDKIKKLFGDAPGLDLDALLGDLNALLSFDICKDIPNLDAEPIYDEFGFEIGHTYIKKGLVPDAPVIDAIKLPPPPTPKTLEEVALAAEDVMSKAKPTIAAIASDLKSAFGTFAAPSSIKMPKIPTIESIPVPKVMGGMQVKFVDAASQLSTTAVGIVNSDATGNLLKSVSGFLPEGFKTNAAFETSFFAKRDKLITVKTNQIKEIKRQQREVSAPSAPSVNPVTGVPSEGTGDMQKDALLAQQGFSNLSKELGSLFSASSINSSVSSYTSKLNTELAGAQKDLETDLAELKAIREAPKSSDNSNHHLALFKDFIPK